jgi:nucleotide-binding universal stress UspA family protein
VAVAGLPAEEIVRMAAAQSSDLIVMGAGARSALDRLFFGTTTREVLHAATCPVLVKGGR